MLFSVEKIEPKIVPAEKRETNIRYGHALVNRQPAIGRRQLRKWLHFLLLRDQQSVTWCSRLRLISPFFFPPAHFLHGSCLKGDAKNSSNPTNKQKNSWTDLTFGGNVLSRRSCPLCILVGRRKDSVQPYAADDAAYTTVVHCALCTVHCTLCFVQIAWSNHMEKGLTAAHADLKPIICSRWWNSGI